MTREKASLRSAALLVLFSLTCVSGTAIDAAADLDTPKLVYLLIEDDLLIASNIRFSRFDEFRLTAKESVQRKAVGDAVAVIATNERIIGYSALMAAWRSIRYAPGETLETVEVEDFSASIITNRRFLNFNGRNGLWAERLR